MKRTLLVIIAILAVMCAMARNVSVDVSGAPAEDVFRTVVRDAGMDYVYPAGLLDGIAVTVHVTDKPLRKVLDMMFDGTDIKYRLKGRTVTLARRRSKKTSASTPARPFYPDSPTAGASPYRFKDVVVVADRNRANATATTGMGVHSLSAATVRATPTIFGESDIIKTLQLEPGVTASNDGLSGMSVHGGNEDGNLFMLDNMPLYEVNHALGIFSSFNSDAISTADFYKTSFPTRVDGRLSSVLDVHTAEGSPEHFGGSVKLGLTTLATTLGGPIGHKGTTWTVSLRRSYVDLFTLIAQKLVNKSDYDEVTTINYWLMDGNARLTHTFSERSKAHISVYFSDDYFRGHSKDNSTDATVYDDTKNRVRWGNIMASAGWDYAFNDNLRAIFTAGYTRYHSRLTNDWYSAELDNGQTTSWSNDASVQHNSVDDFVAKADFSWTPRRGHSASFGASFTFHHFVPARGRRDVTSDGFTVSIVDQVKPYNAPEAALYIGDNWTINPRWRIDAGVHAALFANDGKVSATASPRVSARFIPADNWAVKMAYNRSGQFIYQIKTNYFSLPTDGWTPITAGMHPLTADKISLGAYHTFGDAYTASAEAYWNWMHNLPDYLDDYYLSDATLGWQNRITTGSGMARGIDLKVSRSAGRITWHAAYSLMWNDRRYATRNGGRAYPARLDNRHTINLMMSWRISKKWEMNAAWAGRSGNRITLPTQAWISPGDRGFGDMTMLRTTPNNYRLPFSHHLDLGFIRHTRSGYWNFSIYNAYFSTMTLGVITDEHKFKKIVFVPFIPSVSYTWKF